MEHKSSKQINLMGKIHERMAWLNISGYSHKARGSVSMSEEKPSCVLVLLATGKHMANILSSGEEQVDITREDEKM